ncbi:helicase : Helicase domain protein OS=Desulforudis audaxviator (strain MP104C) GN=Daud_0503 PE=4 SV=1: SNF2_N: Helicase_C [Gemmata massiliana]|uniref:Helicase n=1 Tax=Gemmata massiliana TaxID=1210884 RepID=A0A6P2DH48_9BACT|nr:helicase-related protein [Gemmata massiliana]VTS00987.1 helicase : Helicase domain protein OS=Desulforudis audaxviator (strain MP104C) GN=Daud_0503 PE=4 SV=1: SNF2_N: Helicase_C [Gemmata massiliana]
MSGLLIRELKLRGLAERILIVCPANLAFQWQRELKEKFDEKFVVMKGSDIREQFGVNQWTDQDRVTTSLDLAKRNDILPGLKQARWDLVIVDEAHRMSWSLPAKKTARYALGELLRDSTDHLLLLTATPHKGDPANFSLFLQLLDPDAYADTTSIREAMNNGRAPFYLRRTKEKMVFFPELQPDGSWKAKSIFTKRIPRTVDFHIDGDEYDLYRAVTKFVKRQSAAAANSENPQARAVGFLTALFQRRLASSTFSLRSSLANRATRLDEALKKALNTTITADLPDADELDEMDDAERDKFERQIAAATLSKNADQVRTEIGELRDLAARAKLVEDAQTETKLCKLKDLLTSEGFFTDPGKRLLVFTEFRDTLDYLMKVLKEDWKFTVGCIHGGMHAGDPVNPQPGTRLYAEQRFKKGDTQVLVATEAAGEGINLQCCHVLFNYDIPWNPNRLEQRMGRIHRYGQDKDCLIFNFVATNTIEGSVLQKLLEKLQEIRKALDDAVFNVVGEVLPAAQIERVLCDYDAGKLGEGDLEDELLKDVDEGHFRAICQNALEGLASKKLNLSMLIERKAKAQERRVVPETIARFLAEAAARVPFALKPVNQLPHTFDPAKTPHTLRTYEAAPDWKLPVLADKYPRFTTERDAAKQHSLE